LIGTIQQDSFGVQSAVAWAPLIRANSLSDMYLLVFLDTRLAPC